MLLRLACGQDGDQSLCFLSLDIDPLQLMCPCTVCMGVSRRHRSVQICMSQTRFGVNENVHREQALPGTLQGAAADQND